MIDELKSFLRSELEQSGIRVRLDEFVQEGTSKAGKRPEEVFTREFLCQAITKFFYEYARGKLELSDAQIKSGLGTEGFSNCSGFGFTPAHKSKHLFRKADIIESKAPESWYRNSELRLPSFQACPDFAISTPLPLSVLGETKYFAAGTPAAAVKQLYDAARQAVFYLGAFRGAFDSAMIVVADASPNHAFHEGLQLIRPELLARFGIETGIHLLVLKIQ